MNATKFRCKDGVIYVPFFPASKELKLGKNKVNLKNNDMSSSMVGINNIPAMHLALVTLKPN